MLKKVKNLSAFSPLSPLSLVVLAACGGGGGAAGSSAVTVSGAVVKGPLENALVFLDYDNDGVKDAGEPEVRTDADGNYSISTTNTNYSIVAMTDGSTVDGSSGAVLSGVTLKAPKGAGVVTPTTTLMEETGISAALSTYALQTKDPDLHLKYSYNGETLITIDTDGLSFNDINGTTGIFDNFEVWNINGNFSVGDDADGNVVLYEPTDTVAITVTDITLADYNILQPEIQLG